MPPHHVLCPAELPHNHGPCPAMPIHAANCHAMSHPRHLAMPSYYNPAMPLYTPTTPSCIPGHAIRMQSHTNRLCPSTVGCHSPFSSLRLRTRTLKDIWLVLAIQEVSCTLLLALVFALTLPLSSSPPSVLLHLLRPFFQGCQYSRKKKPQYRRKRQGQKH